MNILHDPAHISTINYHSQPYYDVPIDYILPSKLAIAIGKFFGNSYPKIPYIYKRILLDWE